MRAKKGDHIVIDGNKVGSPTRSGEVLDVVDADDSERYVVRWEDGHQSVFCPGPGVRLEVRQQS